MSTALTVNAYEKVRDPIEFMRIVGDDIAKSGMFGCQTVEQGRILALTCLKKGLDPMSLVETYHLIQGDLSMRADAMLAGLSRVGGKYRVIRRTSDAAEIEISRGEDKQRFSLTWEEAQQEPFTKNKKNEVKDNYATPRSRMQMLWARVVSDGVRTMWPEVVCGAYTPEEIADINGHATVASVQPTSTTRKDDDVIDASFTVTEEAPKPAAKEAQAEDVYASHEHTTEIRRLFDVLKVDGDTQNKILAKRKVTSLRSLTKEQAAELLVGLQKKVAEAEAAAGQQSADQEQAKPESEPTSMNLNDPATSDQVTEIKKLMAEIEQAEPGTVAKVGAKLKACGLSKLADLTFAEARELEQALKVKNLAVFFDAALTGFKPKN